LLLLAVCLLAAASWWWARPKPSPPFEVLARRVTVRVQPSMAVGRNFAAMVAPDGSLWAWGEPEFDLAIPRGWIPQRVGRDTNWQQVAATWAGIVALKQDGSLWGMGSNGEGLLGTIDRSWRVREMTRLGAPSDWREIKGGVAHCMGLKRDGSLWTWGQNQYGQIGCGTVTPSEPFTRIGQGPTGSRSAPAPSTRMPCARMEPFGRGASLRVAALQTLPRPPNSVRRPIG
jgi:alpha-tubulin suppressor-like RCC1 family protein